MSLCITNTRRADATPFREETIVLWNTAHAGSHKAVASKEHFRLLLITGDETGMFRYVPGRSPVALYLLAGFLRERGKPVLQVYAHQADRRVHLRFGKLERPWGIGGDVAVSSLMAPFSELILGLAALRGLQPEILAVSDVTISFELAYFRRGPGSVVASVFDAATPVWKLLVEEEAPVMGILPRVLVAFRHTAERANTYASRAISARLVEGKLQLTDPLGELREVVDTYSVEDVPSRAQGELQEIMQEVRPHEGQTALHARVCGLAKALDTEAESYAAAHDQLVAYERILRWSDNFHTGTEAAITNARSLLKLAYPFPPREPEEPCTFITFPRFPRVFLCPVPFPRTIPT